MRLSLRKPIEVARDRPSERDEYTDQYAINSPEVLLAPQVSLGPALLPGVLIEQQTLDVPAKLTERYVLHLSAPGALFAPGVPPQHLRCLARRGPISVI
jgi:hypothetical protein